MKKELLIQAKLSTEDFDRQISDMQRKLKDLYAPSDMLRMQQMTGQRMQGTGMQMSQPAADAYKRSTQQTKRELDQMIAQEARGQENLVKQLARRVDKLKELKTEYQSLVRLGNEDLQLKERISRMEENNFKLRETYKQRDAVLNQMLDAREKSKPQGMERLMNAYRGGGVGGAMTAGGRMLGGATLGGIGAGVSALSNVVGGAAYLYNQYGQTPTRTEGSMGSAVQGTLGREVNNIYGRRTGFDQLFAPERTRAAQMSLDAAQATRTSDKMGLAANVGGIAGGVALAAGTGGLGALGGVAMAGKGLYGLMTNERQRSLALSPFSSTFGNRYESLMAEQMQQNYSTSYEGQKAQNPFKVAAGAEYEQNFMRNLGAQRNMGLTNKGFYGQGGYLEGATGSGFTPELALGMSQGILGAGGSTRAARSSVFGLQAERGLGLTNSAQVMGTLSGGVGGSEATKQATIKILAEGMKLGLDDSQFAEENRKFTQAAAEIIAKSGAASGGDFDRVAGGFGRFMAEPTGRGLDAAKTAYEQYQQISSTTTGPRGVMRAAGFLSDKDLSKVSTMTKQALMQVPESDLNENNPLVQAAAQEAGISPADVVSKVGNINQGSVSRFKEADTIRDRLRTRMKAMGKDRLSESDIASLPEDMKTDINKLSAIQTAELGYQGQRETTARTLGTLNQGGGGGAAREAAISGRMTGETGRMEDTSVKSMAADSSTVLKNFNDMAPAMKAAAEATAAWTHQIRESNAALLQALEDARSGKGSTNAVQKILEQISVGTKPQNQQQAGKTSK